MFDEVVRELAREGLLLKEPVAFCGDFRRHVKLFFPSVSSARPGVFVKLSHGEEGVAAECQAIAVVTNHFKRFLILPLHFWREGSLSVAAYPLLKLGNVTPAHLARPAIYSQLAELFALFFSQPTVDDSPMKAGDEEIVEFFAGKGFPFFNPLASYFRSSRRILVQGDLVCVQHGDFAINNLAIDSQGKLLLLDWEDYGKITFPYFDLATFLFSVVIAQNRVAEIGTWPQALCATPGWTTVIQTCNARGLAEDEFLRLFPFYMMLFLYLKIEHGYGDYIIDQIEGFLNRVAESAQWADLRSWEVH
jgi:hypothetical protein